MLRHKSWEWHILSLSRAADPDREPRFRRAAREYGAESYMSDLDDSPVLSPLSDDLGEIRTRIQNAVPPAFDMVFTHGASGEYTRHLRHEQAHAAVRAMVDSGTLGGELVFFAYDDCRGQCSPRPSSDAVALVRLLPIEYERKLHIVKDIYGFDENSFEHRASGPVEAFQASIPALQLLNTPG